MCALYTMHNKFSNFVCFASFCAHLCVVPINFHCNDENRILGKLNHEISDAILLIGFGESKNCRRGQ